MSIWIVLTTVLGVLAAVWLAVKLGNNPGERRNLPEEAMMLADFTLVTPQGAWLGVNVLTGKEAFRPKGKITAGAVVSGVMIGSPAYNAGILAGDIIERIGRDRIRTPADLINALKKLKVGDATSVTVSRGGRSRKLRVVLGSQPMGKLAAATGATGAAWFGADVQKIDKLLAKQLGLPNTRGVVVSYVYPDSPASAAGLIQGDAIKRIGETRLRDVDQLKSLIAARRPGDTLRMSVWRKGSPIDVQIGLSKWPPPNKLPKPTLPEANIEIEAAWLGLDVVPLTRAEAAEVGLPKETRGMFVGAVAAGAGIDAGFQAGDVIIAVNGRSTKTLGDFREATEGAVGAVVDVIRFGRHIYLSVPPPGGGQGGGGAKSPVRQIGLRIW